MKNYRETTIKKITDAGYSLTKHVEYGDVYTHPNRPNVTVDDKITTKERANKIIQASKLKFR